jgi:hypothetical protein
MHDSSASNIVGCRNEDFYAVQAAGKLPEFDVHLLWVAAHVYVLTLNQFMPCRNEDFYAVKAAGKLPEFDVLVTNPPFSGDHIERIFRFAVKSDK